MRKLAQDRLKQIRATRLSTDDDVYLDFIGKIDSLASKLAGPGGERDDSRAAQMARMPEAERHAAIRRLTRAEARALFWDWDFWVRTQQKIPQGEWRTWLLLAGRGFGKTRTGAEFVRDRVEQGIAQRIALVGRTAADCRDVLVEGESGLLAICPPWNRPKYEPSKRRLTWPSGALATCYSADEPDVLRGPQHDTAWADELAAWRYTDAWDNLLFGLRLGNDPRVVVTTTPRPTPAIRELIDDPTTRVVRGSTFDNVGHLAKAFLERIVRKYEGTRLGRQELHAEVLDDAPGALWRRDQLDSLRIVPKRRDETESFAEALARTVEAVALRVIVIGIDPATTSGEDSNETGIITVGLGDNGHGYVLGDLSGRYTPDGWGRTAVTEYVARQANRMVAERNQGGDMVMATIQTVARDMKVDVYVTTVHAAKGKRTRAEPVAALYEQGKVHHVGVFPELEDQMCTWEPDVVIADGPRKKVQHSDSPDRLDAKVWALTDLMIDRNPEPKPIVGAIIPQVSWEDREVGSD